MKNTKIFLPVIILSLLLLSSCKISRSILEEITLKDRETTFEEPQSEEQQQTDINKTTAEAPSKTEETKTTERYITTQPIKEEQTTESAPAVPLTKKQIIDTYSAALNKTRSCGRTVSVNHSEKIKTNVVDAHPGGALTTKLANYVVGLVGTGGEEKLSFSNGKAKNKEGKTISLLLPQNGEFTLPESGVASASAENINGLMHIKISLVPEKVSMGEIPAYNAGAIGYLDTSAMDFSVIKINKVDINYTGSVIDAYISSDGLILSVNYTVNMKTYAEVSGLGISGYGTIEGSQIEKWELQW